MFRLILLLGWIPCVIFGCQELYVTLSNPDPYELTLAQYIVDTPSKKWLKLTECDLDVSEWYSVTGLGKGEGEQVIALRKKDVLEGPIHVIMRVRDPKLLDVLKELGAISDPMAFIEAYLEHEAMFQDQTVSGLVAYGSKSRRGERKMFEEAEMDLAEGWVILDPEERPSLKKGIISALLGGGWAFLMLRRFFSSSGKSGSAVPEDETNPPQDYDMEVP